MGTMVLAQKIIKYYQKRWGSRFEEALNDEFNGDITAYLTHINCMIAHDKDALINQLESDLNYTDATIDAAAILEINAILKLLRGM